MLCGPEHFSDVSEQHIFSIIKVEKPTKQENKYKRLPSGAIILFTGTAVRASDPNFNTFSYKFYIQKTTYYYKTECDYTWG
jgi:hypothetical protein